MRILLVEDETELAALVGQRLHGNGFAVDSVDCVEDGLAAIDTTAYALVLLDLRLPDGDGLTVLRHLRAKGGGPPVLILTARDAVEDRVRGLNAGADDYLSKPFAMAELVARIHALLRRPGAPMGLLLRCGRLSYDSTERTVTVGETPLTVPRRELMALEALLRRAGRVVSRESLEEALYAGEEEIESNALEAHLSRLRKRLAAAGAGVAIHTVRGVGYLMKEGDA